MSPEEIIEAISKHSLTIRCLPHKVVSYWTYREGDEERIEKDNYYNSKGEKITNVVRTVVFSEDCQRKMVKHVTTPKNGGWWFVKPTPHTSSTVQFSKNNDKFFAPTLGEAVALYLNRK